MESNLFSKSVIEYIWKFIRGDILVSEFENWIYSNPTLEDIFGKPRYLEIISINYSSEDKVFHLKEKPKAFLISSINPSCICLQLRNIAVVDMGSESEKNFRHLQKLKVEEVHIGGYLSINVVNVSNHGWWH